MLVKEMIEKLKDMPRNARLKVEVSAYYYENDDFDVIDDPVYNEKDNSVTIGEVFAQP